MFLWIICNFLTMKNKGILKFFAGLAIGIGIGFATNSIGIGIGIGIAFGAAFSQGKIVWGKNEKTIIPYIGLSCNFL